jgi:Tol biopolymer transport system component
MRLDGTEVQPFGQEGDHEVAWAPDGRRLAVVRKGGGIDVVERASGRRAPLADGEDPAWTPDGRWIAFVRFDDPSTTLRVIGADGSGERVVFTNRDRGRYSNGWGKTLEGMLSHPVWSPDGRRIVFTRNYRTGFTLWSIDVDGRNLRRIAPIIPPGESSGD